MFSDRRWSLALALVVLSCPEAVHANPELRDKMSALAQDILKVTKQQAVTVGQFTPIGLPDVNSGPGLERLLAAALGTLARDDARFEVKGDYALVSSQVRALLKEVRITVRVIDKETAEELKESRVIVALEGNNSIAQLLQITGSLPPEGSKEERNKKIEEQARKPTVFLHGPNQTLVSGSDQSPYAVEVLVKPLKDHASQQAVPRPAVEHKGQALVKIGREELYEVKIFNYAPREVAVALSVDGIDQFHFSKERNSQGQSRYTHMILGKGSKEKPAELVIVGWHNTIDPHSKENFLSFLVTEYGKGAIEKAGIPTRGRVGVIHVQFSECRPLPDGAKPRGGNETGFGPPREVKQKEVRYEIEPPHDFISVRYQPAE